jgi:two-component system, chemotaxis family, protein-glutamate methylesterase/glutaminase
VEALSYLVAELPPEFPAAVAIVYHQSPSGNSFMPAILKRNSRVPVDYASDGEAITCGRVYLAPPDHHLLIKSGYFRVTRGPRENSSRPAVDPLFRTAASAYGSGVVGVILTGNLGDGTAGLAVIKSFGGIAIVQDPADAPYPGMPRSAIENVQVDYVAPLAQIPNLLIGLVNGPLAAIDMQGADDNGRKDPAEGDVEGTPEAHEQSYKPSVYTCPDCHGTLFEVSRPGEPLVFRCRVGHAFSAENLAHNQAENIEEALYVAVRALEERASLADRLSQRSELQNQKLSSERFKVQAKEIRMRATLLRRILKQGQVEAPDPVEQAQADS